ncbi:hypothetical protein SDC9_07857 [bioreactor metagenome]|uniref:Peptidase S11 D-alanyl-D-alanine carboxypeptidase A N-terminal domain-containing protein n=1 Tax=bioreactor metagenome TaxID=1076179 RepID=A0A644T5N1_9ZZZZ|nr:serine hydrolase [Candidatus Elulimicrobiales bacterium]
MKQKGDLIKYKSLRNLGIITMIASIFFIVSLETVPRLLSKSPLDINKYSNLINKSKREIFDQKIVEVNERHKAEKIQKKSLPENIVAKSYVVYDVRNDEILYSKNPNTVLPLASLTKVVTAATAINLKNADTRITVKSDLMREDEKLDYGMVEGQIWKLSDLLKYGLAISSNSSMDIIASTIEKTNYSFVSKMNDYVKSLGFKNFRFNSASGLDYGEVLGGVGTAEEYAKFFAKSYEFIPEIMSYTTNSRVDIRSDYLNLLQIPNTNIYASQSVGLLASKTGFTDLAGGNLAIMFDYDINRPIVIVVLGSTLEDRFEDVNKLYKTVVDSRK